MTALDHGTTVAFANAIARLRPTWQVPGIRAAIERAADANRSASASEILRAAINLAENGAINTPALLPEPGPWWDTAAANNARPSWAANRVACPEHPQHSSHDCPLCEADRGPELSPEAIAAAAAECKRIADEARQKARAERADLATRQETQP